MTDWVMTELLQEQRRTNELLAKVLVQLERLNNPAITVSALTGPMDTQMTSHSSIPRVAPPAGYVIVNG